MPPRDDSTGAAALRSFMEPFANMLTSSELLAAYGDERSALIVYDTANPAVASAPAAEYLQVRTDASPPYGSCSTGSPLPSPVARSCGVHNETVELPLAGGLSLTLALDGNGCRQTGSVHSRHHRKLLR